MRSASQRSNYVAAGRFAYAAGALVRQRGVAGRFAEEAAVGAGVGHVGAVGAGVGGVAQRLAVAEEEALEAEPRLLRAEGEEGVREEVAREVHRGAGAARRALVRDLRRFPAQVQRADRGALRVAQRGRDAAVLRSSAPPRLPARSP